MIRSLAAKYSLFQAAGTFKVTHDCESAKMSIVLLKPDAIVWQVTASCVHTHEAIIVMTESNDNRFSKEYAPCFILEDKYYHQLTTPNQIALYSFVARNAYREVPFSEIDFSSFCQPMGISSEEVKHIIQHFYEIGYITKGN